MPVYAETIEYNTVGQKIKEILNYLVSPELQQSVFSLKIVFIIISVLFLGLIVYFLSKSGYLHWKFLFGLKNFL